jgi:hypothetical protein
MVLSQMLLPQRSIRYTYHVQNRQEKGMERWNTHVRGVLYSCLRTLCILIVISAFWLGSSSTIEAQSKIKFKATAHSVTLSWTASTTPGVSYNIYRGATKIGNVSTLTYTDTTVAAGTTYSYSLTALCVSCTTPITGEGSHSAAISVTTPGTTTTCTSIIIGCRIQVTPGSSPRNVRGSGPASGYGLIIGTEPGGIQGTMIGGPNPSSLGFSWLQVTFDSCSPVFTGSTNCTGWIASSQVILIGGTVPPPVLSITCATAVLGVKNLPSGSYSMSITSGTELASCVGTK